MQLLERYRQWRNYRRMMKVVSTCAGAVLVLAEQQRGRPLTDEEPAQIGTAFGEWIHAEPSRIVKLAEQPERYMRVFLAQLP